MTADKLLPPKEWFDNNLVWLTSDYVEARAVEWEEYLHSVDKPDGIENTEEFLAEAYVFALQHRHDFIEFTNLKWTETMEHYYSEAQEQAHRETNQ